MINNFILIGFDRSGTSAISKAIGSHPDVNLVYRPFNSGPIRQKMHVVFNSNNVSKEDEIFFNKLENGEFYSDYVVSEWHKKFSNIEKEFEKDKLHVLITNINHFTVSWVKTAYPKIEQWAIWRDPKFILNSCIKNDFYGDWYNDFIIELVKAVRKSNLLLEKFEWILDDINDSNVTIKTAFIIAIRNYFLFYHIDKKKVISYDLFKKDPNQALEYLCEYFKLSKEFSFQKFLEIDLNSIPSIDGYQKGKEDIIEYDNKHSNTIERLFAPLYDLI